MLYFLSADNGYSNQLRIAVSSLVENTDMSDSKLRIFDFGLDERVKAELLDDFEHIEFIVVQEHQITDLGAIVEGISFSAYARLLIPKYIGDDTRVVYLDCDVLIKGDISTFDWGCKCPIHAVRDMVPSSYVKVLNGGRYFNSGVLFLDFELIDTEKWFKKVSEICSQYRGKVPHHDQGILNHLFDGVWCEIDSTWNYMTPYHYLSTRIGKILYGDHFVSGVRDKESVVIFHLTAWIFSRPWTISSNHFMNFEYREAAIKVLGNINWYTPDNKKARTRWVHYLLRQLVKW